MTEKERHEKVAEWLKTVKAGDKVCVTNVYNRNLLLLMRGLMNLEGVDPRTGQITDEEICYLTTIRGVLPDGCVVVDNTIYDHDGKMIGRDDLNGNPSIHPVTDELITESEITMFCESIRNIDWKKFEYNSLLEISNVIEREVKRIASQKKEDE